MPLKAQVVYTGRTVAPALISALEAVQALGEDVTVVEISAGENMPIRILVDADYWGVDDVDVAWYVYDGELRREA